MKHTVGIFFTLVLYFAEAYYTYLPKVTSRLSTSLYSSDRSRRDILRYSVSLGTLAITETLAKPAFADVTNKIASQASLRYIKRSIKELEKLEFYASQNDYIEMKQGIRGPGISEIRKNAVVLIRGGEDGPEATNLQNAYESFIRDIEALDGAASMGVRGRKGIDMYPSYQKSVNSLVSFADIAVRSVETPFQGGNEGE